MWNQRYTNDLIRLHVMVVVWALTALPHFRAKNSIKQLFILSTRQHRHAAAEEHESDRNGK